MGCWKSIKMLAEEGNRDAVLQAAEMYRSRSQYPMAIHWYSKIGKTKEIEELTKLIADSSSYAEEDIF